MAFLAGIAPAIQGIIGGIGSVISGVAAMQAAAYQKKVADMNAQIAQDNAKRAIERTQIEAQDNDAEVRAMFGAQEAGQSASGLALGGRSQVMTRKAAAVLGRRDTLNIRQAGEIEAYNYKVQAENQTAAGNLAMMEGKSNMLGSFLQGASSLIGGFASVKSPGKIVGSSSKFDPWVRNGVSLRR